MENAQQCRAIALLCRQQVSFHPQDSWKWLAQAERWEHLADARLVVRAETPIAANSKPASLAPANPVPANPVGTGSAAA
ncbi:hypothetical protein [Bradyrhizobium erythrophlei]|jgi:hypothetical protein|uniref:Uncharacterized protein n=1 Tax=Bradyrhizobium erythrophlei TaxID=1437360 RepID=A0A1M7UFE1_9BRAD|nr:hypothetical protein [Bradyrhizobium erythrophlei]SHN81640.1 hypothetical protein SAMN05444170_4819 [Bradyrhizobium erythrophlei]